MIVKLVERIFALLTEKQLTPRVFRSTGELEAAIVPNSNTTTAFTWSAAEVRARSFRSRSTSPRRVS